MITVAPRSQEASQQHLSEHHRMESAQSNVAEQFGKHVKSNAEVVIHSSKSEQNEYRYDAKEKGNGNYHGNGKKRKNIKQDEENKAKKTEEIKISNFDIKI